MTIESPTVPVLATEALETFVLEASRSVDEICATGGEALQEAAHWFRQAARVFVVGAGCSGLALRMTAMRLMHLGLEVHVVGDVTTPAVGEGDVLIAASASGTTAGIVRASEVAKEAGAGVVAITATPDSPLGRLADEIVRIPAATKHDLGDTASQQYAGGLFEQVLVLVGDALFHTLWKDLGESAGALWTRHANVEWVAGGAS